MSTQIVLRQKTLSVAFIIIGLLAFATLLTMSGLLGHLASLYGISYAEARAIILATINNYISSLPFLQQLIAKAEFAAILALYHAFGLQWVIAW
jgi:hypothetical protein